MTTDSRLCWRSRYVLCNLLKPSWTCQIRPKRTLAAGTAQIAALATAAGQAKRDYCSSWLILLCYRELQFLCLKQSSGPESSCWNPTPRTVPVTPVRSSSPPDQHSVVLNNDFWLPGGKDMKCWVSTALEGCSESPGIQPWCFRLPTTRLFLNTFTHRWLMWLYQPSGTLITQSRFSQLFPDTHRHLCCSFTRTPFSQTSHFKPRMFSKHSKFIKPQNTTGGAHNPQEKLRSSCNREA